jgi:hypothetical protein
MQRHSQFWVEMSQDPVGYGPHLNQVLAMTNAISCVVEACCRGTFCVKLDYLYVAFRYLKFTYSIKYENSTT